MKNIFIFIITVLLTAGCATQLKIETDSDKVYDLSIYNTNSFRRTWNTLAGQHPDPVSEDLRERQGRWRRRSRSRVLGRMVSLYFAPRPQELLLATYWL